MINSSNTVTVRSTSDGGLNPDGLATEPKPSYSGAIDRDLSEIVSPKSEDSDSCATRGIKRPIEDDDDDDDDYDETSPESEQYKEELDDDSSEDKGWENFPELRKQRGRGRLSRTYGLRPRTGIRRAWVEGEAPPSVRGTSRRGRGRASALKSKYRRNTANARERDRMKEINVAFANLRGALPAFTCRRITSMTKIKTLKLAASYIGALSDLLSDSPSEESKSLALQLFQDIPEQNSFLNSMKHNLGTSMSSAYDIPCSSHNASNSLSNLPVIPTSTMNIVTTRASSALEAALTNTSKRSPYGDGHTQRFYSHSHHMASRPNFVPPPPLQLNNIKNISSLHSSPTQHSPSQSLYPLSPVVPKVSDCSTRPNFVNSPSTIITANVNVIPLAPENSSSDQLNLLTPNSSPISKKTLFPQSFYSASSSQSCVPCSRSENTNISPNSNSQSILMPDSPSSSTMFSSKVSLSSNSPGIPLANNISAKNFDFSSQIRKQLQGKNSSTSITGAQYHPQLSNQSQHSPQLQSFFTRVAPHEHSSGAPQQLHTNLQQPCEVQPTGTTHNFLRNLPPKNSLSPLPQAASSSNNKFTILNEMQFSGDTLQPADNLKEGPSYFQGPHNVVPKSGPTSSSSPASITTADSSVQNLPQTSHSSSSTWNSMNVEFNSLLDDSEYSQEEHSLNWDELCWSLG